LFLQHQRFLVSIILKDSLLIIYFYYLTDAHIKIKKPPVLPSENEVFNCAWGDFIDDKSTLDLLKAYDGCWIVNFFSKDFYKDRVICNVTLYEEKDYLAYKEHGYI
jgi:hypothetical protein